MMRTERGGARTERSLAGLALLALAVTAVARFGIGRSYPFWLDETWTGALSADRSLHVFFGDVLNDANAPLYYAASWLWARLFGVSDEALRSLAAVFGLAAPFVALAAPLDRLTRWTWCALLACWVEGLAYSQDARCYTLLLLTSVVSAVLYLRLLQAPSTAHAAAWCAAASLTILTHYFAALPALAQGVVYLAVHRRAALRTWPAALALVPLGAWMALHAPRALAYAQGGVAWYDLVRGELAWSALVWVWGQPKAMFLLAAATAAGLPRRRGSDPERRAPWLLALAALAAALLMLGLGAVRPVFTERYLCPTVPGLLLAPALVCTDPRRRFRAAPLALVGAALLGVLAWARKHEMPFEHVYSFERASAWIAEGRPRQVLFFWDNPSRTIQDPASLARVGGFFFDRAGLPITTRALWPPPGADPNRLLAEAGPQAATLWIYRVGGEATDAHRWPPRPQPGHDCRTFGGPWIGVFACRPQV